jgi:MFS family permease
MGALQGGAFLVAFALALGATNFEIGILAAIPFLAQVSQLLAIYLVERLRNRKAITVGFATASRLVWLIIIGIPFIFIGKQGVTLFMFALFISSILGAVGGNSWNSMLRDLVPEGTLGRLFSRRMMIGTSLALALTLLAGYFVDFWKSSHTELHAFSILFSCGLVFGLVGTYFLSHTPEPAMGVREEKYSLWNLLSHPFHDENFRNLIFFASVWGFAINTAAPFFTVYMLKRLGLDLFLVSIFITISQVSNILFLRIWGRFCDRFSNKSVLSISCALFLIVIIAWTFTTMPERYFLTIPLLVIIHILSGISLAGVSLASGNIALKLSPHGHAAAYLASHGLVSNIAAAAAPLLGGILADFFAVRELSFTLSWAEPGRELALRALSFEALDFLFLFAFVVGLYALHRLARVKEEGEVTEEIVVRELMAEVARNEKSLSTIGGLRHLTFFPLHLVARSLHSFSWLWEEPRSREL